METIEKHFSELVAFHHVAVTKHFGRAADQLGTSKGLVSKQIKRLEASLGNALFHRTTRRVQLTEEGETLHHYTRQIFEIAGEAGRRLGEVASGTSGALKLSAPVSIGEAFFPDLVRALHAELPQVTFDIDLSNEPRDLVEHKIDFSIRASDRLEPDAIARYIGHIRDVIVASPALVKKSGAAKWREPKALQEVSCILSSYRPAWNTWTFHKGADDFSIEVTGQHATNQYVMARAFALSGFGFAKLPYYLVKPDIDAGRLVQCFKDYELRTHPLYIVYLKSHYSGQKLNQKKRVTKTEIFRWFKSHPDYFVRPR